MHAFNSEVNLFNSESVNAAATETPKSPKKHRSPASKASQMNRLLQHQQQLVIQKGLPTSRLHNELNVTPNTETLQHVKSAKFRKNLLSNFQDLESNTEAPCPTSQSLSPAEVNCLESKTDNTKCIDDYHAVVSSGYKSSSSLSHSRYESDQRDNLSSHISSVSLAQSADYDEEHSGGKVHVLSVPELSIQSTDGPGSRKDHVPKVINPDFKHLRESEMVGSQCKNNIDFGMSSGTSHNAHTLNAESFQSEHENFQTSAQSLLPQGGIYLSLGWYVNVGAAYCGGCQLYGTLLQKLQM